jgi:putative transposase
MPRQARLDAPGTLHHVMIRGIEGKAIFRDNRDRKDFVSRLGTLSRETGSRILAWALLRNHAHLLLFSGPSGLALFVRRLLTGYAQGFNRKHKRRGHLFQNRYKSIVCEEDTYLLELVRYIHLNPLRASFVKNVGELDRYPWSGHRVLVGREKNDWQERDYVLRRFHRQEKEAIRNYRRFLEEGKDRGRRPELVGGGLIRSLGGWSEVLSLRRQGEKVEYDSRILGGGDFVADILREADQRVKRYLPVREKGALKERIIKEICEKEGVGEGQLRQGGQTRRASLVRSRIAWRLSREYGIPMAEIARDLGVCTSAIAKAIRKKEGRA